MSRPAYSQWVRHLLRVSVLLFIVYAAFGGAWRNYKVAHNSARIVSLLEGDWVGKLYAANESWLGLWGEPLAVSSGFLGMPWTITLFGYTFTDPILVFSQAVTTRSIPAGLALTLLVPLLLVAVLGKVFCSHLCPMRLMFEIGQVVRAGLMRVGFWLPELRSGTRLGGWVLLGGLVAAVSATSAVWLFLLPYYGLGAAIVGLVTAGSAAGLLWVPGLLWTLDALVAPGFFCHNLCPQGFLLERFNRFSLWKLRSDPASACPEGCHTCERACPYGLSPRLGTQGSACDNCGQCARYCPKRKLARKFALPVVTALLFCLLPDTAWAHHNKGLPHYGYFENYPQVPTTEIVNVTGHWEMGASVFNFQGYDRRSSDTPRDVKFFIYLYDLKQDAPYVGPLNFELRLDGEIVTSFQRAGVDEESIYTTRETLPESGQYELVAILPGQASQANLYFDISLGDEGPNWFLIGGMSAPLLLLFGLALLGRTRQARARRLRPAATSSAMLLATLLGLFLSSTTRLAHAAPPPPDCPHHAQTADGSIVMIMPGLPPWLLVSGVICVIIASFIAVERFGLAAPGSWRFNLLKNKRVYSLAQKRWIQALPQLLAVVVLGLLVYFGLTGSQVRNITPVFVWTIWWAGLIFAVFLLGPIFCFGCPWDGVVNLLTRVGGWFRIEQLSLNLPVPRWLRSTWPALLLFVILTWAELGLGITTSPMNTAYMGIGMAALALSSALLFEKKAFCRYWCPVGRITGIYSNFSPVEVRARNHNVCQRCTTEDCKEGNENGYACPTGLSLKVLNSSSYCVGCTECVKSCNKRNVALNLRPFASDLAGRWTPKPHEAALAVGLLVLTLFHGLSMTTTWENHRPGTTSLIRWMQLSWGTPGWFNFTAGMLAVMALLVGLYWLSCELTARITRATGLTTGRIFNGYALSLLPIALFYHLAHNAMHLFGEGDQVVPMLSDPAGLGDDYFGTLGYVPGHLLSDTTLWYLQVALIVTGHIFGVIVAHRISRKLFSDSKQATRSLIPMLALMVMVSAVGLTLMALDMNMRTGRM